MVGVVASLRDGTSDCCLRLFTPCVVPCHPVPVCVTNNIWWNWSVTSEIRFYKKSIASLPISSSIPPSLSLFLSLPHAPSSLLLWGKQVLWSGLRVKEPSSGQQPARKQNLPITGVSELGTRSRPRWASTDCSPSLQLAHNLMRDPEPDHPAKPLPDSWPLKTVTYKC